MPVRLHLPGLAPGALGPEAAHYLGRVLRLAAGDELTVFDGGEEAPARISWVDGQPRIELLGAPRRRLAGGPYTVLVPSLLKGEKMDLVVQKATELGAHLILPAAAARSVVRLDDDRRDARRRRHLRIAEESARQCERADLPVIGVATTLAEALAAAPAGLRLLFHEKETHPLRAAIPPVSPETVVLAVGPEGGFTDEEVGLARGLGYQVVSLGARILRAETASIAALAAVGYALSLLDRAGPG